MNLIRLLLSTSWSTVLLAMLVGLLSGASSTGLIATINTTLSSTKPPPITLIGSFALLCLLMLITNVVSQVLLVRLAQGAIFDLRMLLSRRILASPLRQLEELGAPRLLATLTDDIQSVSTAFFEFPFICTNIAIVVSCLIYLASLSWIVFLMMLGVMVVAVTSFQSLTGRGHRSIALAREEQDRLFKHFRTLTEGIKELKLNRQRQTTFLYEDLRTTATASRHYNVVGTTTFALASSSGLFSLFVTIGLLLFAFPRLLDIHHSVLSSYALVIIYLIIPMEGILNGLPTLTRANVGLAKIEALGLSLAAYKAEVSMTDLEPQSTWKCLELIGVTHTYRGESEENGFVLGPIDLTFYPGELVFILGGNGSGKSTLAKLLVGLYIPETGKICFDGEPITDENREWYRQHFSAIFANFYLFERFLGFGSPDINMQVQDYLVKLQLDHKVQVKNGVLSTTALSQGQRKRLALLTAYLENRPIYLFDEWASDQDPIFKEIFYRQLLPELKRRGKTVLVISHDERYFHVADRIVKLEYGKLEFDQCPLSH